MSNAVNEAKDNVVDVLDVECALNKLKKQSPRKAEWSGFVFSAGLTLVEAAKVLGISSSTADNDWAYAKTCCELKWKSQSSLLLEYHTHMTVANEVERLGDRYIAGLLVEFGIQLAAL